MNWRNILLAFTVIWSATACVNAGQNEENRSGFSFSASTNLAEKSLVVMSKMTDKKLEVVDSTYVTKGKFEFKGESADESILYYITFGNVQPPGIPVIMEEGAKVKAEINKMDKWYDLELSGGVHNGSMLKLYELYSGYEKTLAAFNTEVAQIDPATVTQELRTSTTQKYNAIIKQRLSDIRTFIKTEPASPATYFAAKYLFQKPEQELIILAADKMEKELPSSSYTTNLVSLKSQLGPTVVGAMAPDIELQTPEGEMLKLSSLRGKVVLIDFWASWCGPCRRENPNVKRIYDMYKDRGFEIYGVSLDNNADRWKAAIAKDGLTWPHVSDLKGWQSSAAQLYGVRGIPATFLIDEEGRIIKTNFRSHELAGLLEQALGSN